VFGVGPGMKVIAIVTLPCLILRQLQPLLFIDLGWNQTSLVPLLGRVVTPHEKPATANRDNPDWAVELESLDLLKFLVGLEFDFRGF
jgi:hypothetical protein